MFFLRVALVLPPSSFVSPLNLTGSALGPHPTIFHPFIFTSIYIYIHTYIYIYINIYFNPSSSQLPNNISFFFLLFGFFRKKKSQMTAIVCVCVSACQRPHTERADVSIASHRIAERWQQMSCRLVLTNGRYGANMQMSPHPDRPCFHQPV